MIASNDPICEQLSAWMDGELSPEEAKFLERRLQHDEHLQAMYARMQLMSSCIKGQQVRPMPRALCENIKAQLANEARPAMGSAAAAKKRSPIFAWAAAASVAALAVIFAPRLWQETAQPSVSNPGLVSLENPDANAVPSFASADMVGYVPTENTPQSAAASLPITSSSNVLETPAINRGEQSPMPLASVESPENFPLNVSTQKKTWPRSSLANGNDPVLEAYLVRHNQMMTGGELGGFVPYVDVMTDSDAAEANKQ
jgi:negative regulator of sigma E activity